MRCVSSHSSADVHRSSVNAFIYKMNLTFRESHTRCYGMSWKSFLLQHNNKPSVVCFQRWSVFHAASHTRIACVRLTYGKTVQAAYMSSIPLCCGSIHRHHHHWFDSVLSKHSNVTVGFTLLRSWLFVLSPF